MRWTVGAVVSATVMIAIVGCSSSPSSATPTQAPGGPTQAPGGPTQRPVAGTGHECDAIPTFSLSASPNPATPPPDVDLLAHFPAQIDGQPVTDAQAQYWIYLLCAFGGQASVDRMMAEAQGGFNIATMSFGEATATVDGEEVKLNAFRAPGTDASSLVQSLALLAAQSGSLNGLPGTATTATVGGKSVYISTDSDGQKSYAYVSGDTLIFFRDVTDSQAAKIAAALP